MAHRLISLVLVAFIGVTPIAREICELSCAEHHNSSGHAHHDEGQSMTGHHHMSHHEMAGEAVPSSQVILSAAAHGCRHDTEAQPVSMTAKLEIAAPALLPRLIDSAAAVPSMAAPHTPVLVAALTPVPIALRRPLRI